MSLDLVVSSEKSLTCTSTPQSDAIMSADLSVKMAKIFGHKTIAFVALPIYAHIPNVKGLAKIVFKVSRPKGNLCSGGGVTVLNPKYPNFHLGIQIYVYNL